MAYKSLLRSNREYCSNIWSPHTKNRKPKSKKFQCRTARYTTGRFHNTSSVTSMLDYLKWNSLDTHRNIAKVTAVHNNRQYGRHQSRPLSHHTRCSLTSGLQYQTFSASTDYFKFSFFPHTVVLWNTLPPDIVSASSLDQFKSQIQIQNC